jgi:hypothetical protein
LRIAINKKSYSFAQYLFLNHEFDAVRPKFEEVANRYMPNRVVHATEIAGKLTMEGGIAYITFKY